MAVDSFDAIVREYVWLALQLHNHDPNPYIYIGDPELRAQAQTNVMPLDMIDRGLNVLEDALGAFPETQIDGGAYRRQILAERITAMQVRSGILQGRMPASFTDEVHALYSLDVPHKDEAHFRALASDLEQIVPGSGPLPERLVRFRDRFLIAPDRIQAAMTEALHEARTRTLAHFDLPETEGVTVQMDTEGHFSGFAEYLGQGRTIVHFSQTQPLHLDRVVELATHEAYPGHHVQGTLIEAELVHRRGWLEWTMLPLFGAHTVLAEGAANYGVRLAFDRETRLAFDRDVVLPMTGLSHLSADLDAYHHYVDLVEKLNFARNEVARGFLYDGWDRDYAIEWLMTFGLETRGTATQRLAIIQALRSYVVTYNCGLDWVTQQIENVGAMSVLQKWQGLKQLLETPIIPVKSGDFG